MAGPSGVPEVGKDNLPPESPPLAAYAVSKTRQGAAAHHIRSECERFCCETLGAIFLGEGKLALEDSLELDAQQQQLERNINGGYLLDLDGLSSSTTSSATTLTPRAGLVRSFLEVWDYEGGCRFRGFVAERDEEIAMFVFFDQGAFGHGLKPAMIALIDLCDASGVECDSMYVCVDRRLKGNEHKSLLKDLRWVGFEATTLADWTIHEDITSDRWIFVSMHV